uniref:DUF3352 domain-containing protein n=1 Tax=Chlorobium chlorochromatii (strain CaD3) TaxID=340177 RepID=Q3APS9_CHLCH
MEPKRSLKRGAGLLMSLSALSILSLVFMAIWVNWEKPRQAAEPLTPEVKNLVDRIPSTTDALIYIGMKDIRQSRLWQEVIPDSLKQAPLFQPTGELATLLERSTINPSKDIDTLLISFKRHGYKEQLFLAIASGNLQTKLPKAMQAGNHETLGGHSCYSFGSSLWFSQLNSRRVVLSNSKELLGNFLQPQGSFLQRDSLTTTLIDKARYKSHLWFALPSAAWTSGALQSLTSSNKDVKSIGNLNRIKHLTLSVNFKDGIEAESEWLYESNQAAYFASTFLWGAIQLPRLSEKNEQTRALLDNIAIQQNLNSVIIHTALPLQIFQTAKEQPAP